MQRLKQPNQLEEDNGKEPPHVGEYDSVRGNVVSKLRELGLSSYGARAFLAILENQPASATSICKVANIPDSKVYYALKELEDKKLVMIQHGTPSIYRTLTSKQVLSGLKNDIELEYNRKIECVRQLERSIEPIVARRSASNTSDIDFAYIVKGFRNIVEKMKEAAEVARKEIVFLATDEKLVLSLEETLLIAKNDRGVSVKIALPCKLLESKESSKTRLRANKALLCDCNVMMVDSEKLVTAELADPDNQYGMITQNQSMITLLRKSYDNPSCCAK